MLTSCGVVEYSPFTLFQLGAKMSQLQPQIQLQEAVEEPLPNNQQMQFWLDKAVAWGQADRPNTRKDTCLHLSRLRDFLQQLLTHIDNMSSTTETLKSLPLIGQLLGRLCWNPCATADATSRKLLFDCLWGLYSEHPDNAVERRANQWIRKVFCQLATEDENPTAQALMKHTGVQPKEYHLKVLRKKVAMLQEKINKSCRSPDNMNMRCSCDSIQATSEACVPLVTCPEAAPLIGALLQQPGACVRVELSESFKDSVSSAYSSKCLSLEEQAVVSMWYENLLSLEEEVLRLLANTESAPQQLEQKVTQSLLPKACAQHCSLFLVVNDIFRSILKQAEGNEQLKRLIQTFTTCFLTEMILQQHQTGVSLKNWFPQSPPAVLVPLLALASEMPQEAWTHHLIWLSSSLQRLTEEEEEEEEREGGKIRSSSSEGHHKVFEAWFLLVQCAHWVQAALQLLVSSGFQNSGPLLWLLTFYHHPTNRGHHRATQLVNAKEASEHLHALFSASAPPPGDRLQSLVTLMSPHPQRPPPPTLLILQLLVNFAVFSQQSASGSTEILQAVVERSALADEAARLLSSLELKVIGGSCLSGDANRVHLRIKAFQNTLTQMHTARSPAHTHTHTLTL